MLPPLESIVLVIISGILLSTVPGPSMLYVLSRSIGQNQKAGVMSSAGLAFGGMIHAMAAALGLSTIVALSPSIFAAIQIFGVIYLSYLGITMLQEKIGGDELAVSKVSTMDYRTIFVQGVIVEVSNPKTILFFLAFIPSILSSNETYSSTQLFILGLLIPLSALPSDLFISFTGSKIAEKFKSKLNLANRINKISGVILLLLALKLAMT